MPEKSQDFFRQALPWVATLFLSLWGGAVAHLTRNRNKKFNCKELLLDLLVSSFVGVLTHLLCQSAGLNGSVSAMLIAISGHMGTRALGQFQTMGSKFLQGAK